MARYLTNEEMVSKLKKAVGPGRKHGRWAHMHGVNPAVLSLVLDGKRDVPQSIALALGYQKMVRFVKTPKED